MRTALSARVSTERQTLAHTIAQQVERLTAPVYAPGETLRSAAIVRNDGYRGATLNRPGLDRLRDHLKEATIERVILTRPDRLARHDGQQMVLLEACQRAGGRLALLDQPLGQDPPAHLLLQIRGAVAEYARTLSAERLRRGRQRKLRAGILLPWTMPPDGYRGHPDRPRDPAGVQIEPVAGASVQEVCARSLAAEGTLLGLATHFLQRGIKSPRGHRRWSAASLHGLLSNPAYTGQVSVGRTHARPARSRRAATPPLGKPAHRHIPMSPEPGTVVATMPPRSPQDTFARVQAQLARNKRQAPRNTTAPHDFLRA
jgi:site-specific DNA recombinase